LLSDDGIGLELVRLSDYDGDLEAVDRLPHEVWPEFLFHAGAIERRWQRLIERFPDYQLALCDLASGDLVGTANTIPFALGDADLAARHDGWDGVLEAGTADDAPPPDMLSGLGIAILPAHRRPGASAFAIEGMKQLAREGGFPELVGPLRPTLKHRYPLTPFDRYVGWRRADGQPFDPWLRRHVSIGARIVGPCPESMRVEAGVADWERWTGLAMPESGRYLVPGALAPVEVDRELDRALYVEPNLWIRHPLG
jgi:hypothetical protein